MHDDRVTNPVPASARAQAAREQAIERTQDEIDAAAIEGEREPREPEDALDLPSQERLFEQPTRRAPRA